MKKRSYGRGFLTRKKKRGVEYGNFIMRYWVGGDERQESTGTADWKAANALLNERLGEIATGRAPAPGLQRITIAELLDDYVAAQEVEQRPSVRSTRGQVEQVKAGLGKLRGADLTTKHLRQFVTACRKADYAEATIGRFLDCLKAALNVARLSTPSKFGLLPAFPVIDESGNVRQGFATVAQMNVILDSLAAFEQDLADAIEWLFWTGMRKGALARLGWDLWDRETETLRLPPAGRKKRTPKAIPLPLTFDDGSPNPLRAIVDRRLARQKEYARETGKLVPLIFWRVHKGAPRPGLRPGDAVAVYECRKAWQTAVEKAGCPKLLIHDLCRTAIRNGWKASKDRRRGMLLSGRVTDSIYDRYNIDAGEDLVGHLGKLVEFVEQQPQAAPDAVPAIARRRRKAAR